LVIQEGLPFNFVESKHLRNVSNIEPICVETLMKFMGTMTKYIDFFSSISSFHSHPCLIFIRVVEAEIKKILPATFALIFDGWDQDGSGVKYIAVYASFLGIDQKPLKGMIILCEFLFKMSHLFLSIY